MQNAESQVVAGNTPLTQPENRAFYPALDGLRAIAFLMVFLQHYMDMPWGWTGVDLFFVLSGFLITGILFDSRADTYRVRNFYVRRTLRIFPLYYGIMLALLLIAPIVHWPHTWAWMIWPAYLGNFSHDIRPVHLAIPYADVANFQLHGVFHHHPFVLYLGHLWSLCVEEQFYLVWPWIIFAGLSRSRLTAICAAMLPICLAARLFANHFFPHALLSDGYLYTCTPFRLDALLVGGLLALVLRGPHAQALLRYARAMLPMALLAIVLCFALTRLHRIFMVPYPYPGGMYSWCLTVIDLVAGLLVLVAIQPGSWLYRMLNLAPLRSIGRITYGAYVLHDIPHGFYRDAAKHVTSHHVRIGTSALALLFTLLLAHLSYRFFESPFLNLKERWTTREPGRPPHREALQAAAPAA